MESLLDQVETLLGPGGPSVFPLVIGVSLSPDLTPLTLRPSLLLVTGTVLTFFPSPRRVNSLYDLTNSSNSSRLSASPVKNARRWAFLSGTVSKESSRSKRKL